MGPVATMEYSKALTLMKQLPEVSPRSQRAQRAAVRIGQADSIAHGGAAARGAGHEAMRRGALMQAAADDAEATQYEEDETRRIGEALDAWRERRERAAEAADALKWEVDAEAKYAMWLLRREHPAATAAEEAERARVVRGMVRWMAAEDGGGGEEVEFTHGATSVMRSCRAGQRTWWGPAWGTGLSTFLLHCFWPLFRRAPNGPLHFSLLSVLRAP